jgi:cell division transport system permease protein
VARALQYFFTEAAASLWRSRRAAALAVLTIGAGLFVLGFFLIVNTNLQQLVGRWTESAELSVYLRDDITPEQLRTVESLVDRSGLAARREHISKAQAAARFRQDFPDLAGSAEKLDPNPFPASVEVRLKPEVRNAGDAVGSLAMTVSGVAGVADVRYDRAWLERLNVIVRVVRGVALTIVILMAFASAMTVANVVRLTAQARSEEIEIMQLVGAPIAYVRGPFVAEGLLQGGAGAVMAILALWVSFVVFRARYGQAAADTIGLGTLTFLPAHLWIVMILGGMALGCLGGFVVARGVR